MAKYTIPSHHILKDPFTFIVKRQTFEKNTLPEKDFETNNKISRYDAIEMLVEKLHNYKKLLPYVHLFLLSMI